tara:strand:- start:6140 stop:7462 length:1323 start_codon:yes stop_codon:yes gene_type:complete
MKFVDLYAGLGGFHVGLAQEGNECVYASEINTELNEIYQKNFGIKPNEDITKVNPEEIPNHDILCAGFPCQPFSKAGKQLGLECSENGKHVFKILEIAKIKKPKFILLENVPHLLQHNRGKTFGKIRKEFRMIGYDLSYQILSPNDFGIPHLRQRLFILLSTNPLDFFEWPKKENKPTHIKSILGKEKSEKISKNLEFALEKWQEFTFNYKDHKNSWNKLGFPIWAMEFGATYPYVFDTPWNVEKTKLSKTKGLLGLSMTDCKDWNDFKNKLPAYAIEEKKTFPEWKIRFISNNRLLYNNHNFWIKPWMKWLYDFDATLQKFEPNFDINNTSIWDNIIQSRSSGLRVKRPDCAPSLVSIGSTSPIIGWEKRYMTKLECFNLQSLGHLKFKPTNSKTSWSHAIGNAVSAKVTNKITKKILEFSSKKIKIIKDNSYLIKEIA